MARASWLTEFASVADNDVADDDEVLAEYMEAQDEDLPWHVRIAPDDVKVVNLERLDDLYRLSLIDDATLVWQDGMREWIPLGTVIALEPDADSDPDAETKVVAVPKSDPVTAVVPIVRAPSLPPPPVAKAPSLPPPPVAKAPSAPPPPVKASVAPLSTKTPAPFESVAPPSSTAPMALDFEPPSTLRPLAFDDDFRAPPARDGLARVLIVAAAAAGLFLTLYRNDMLKSAAHSAGNDGAYASFQSALGGPSFGTPASVEFGAAPAPESKPVAASRPVNVPSTVTPAATTPSTVTPAATTPSDTHGAVVDVNSLPSESSAAAASHASADSPKRTVTHRAPAAAPKPVSHARRSKSKVSEYDPLNPKL